ncbi:type II toxin-antitoxin system RatA family toxin [Hyphomonas sp.]|uniref:type II toxin-antitoxin system RatA family toxin n=1 Tax=Hyphomonas sp. TaxID=87 RepID=UPI0025C6A02E|nr:type II toxin-antitoxin system RatA family toxin [Hyphomonas sp.]
MPHFSKSVHVPFSGTQAFELVSDIAAYPDFIKWITAMRVSEMMAAQDGSFTCLGEAAVGFKGFVERFTTRVEADPNAGSVVASLVKGPFRKLRAEWKILASNDAGSDISLAIDYDFKNPFIGMLAKANQELAVSKILSAFLAEADRRYGQGA